MIRYSIIIPTYNHFSDCLLPCIDSVIKHTDLSEAEIIVVANGCTDETEGYIDSLGGLVRLLSYPEPIGFTKACNAGIDIAKGEYIILLNNDSVILDNGWVDILNAPFRTDNKVGISGCAKNYHRETEIEFILFFCCMFRKSLWEEVGKLDEVFNPGYGEDIDFAHKVRQLGLKSVQEPNDIHLTDIRTDHTLNFPIWHQGSITVHEVKEWDTVVPRNEAILLERWGGRNKKIDKLDIGNKLDTVDFKDITSTIDSITAQVTEDGLIKGRLNDRTTFTLAKSGYIHGMFPGRDNINKDKLEVNFWDTPDLSSKESIKEYVLDSGGKTVEQFGARWEGGYCTQQNPDEIASLLFYIKDIKIKSYLEIGVADGGVTRLICDVAEVGDVTHIDIGWGDMNHPYTYRENLENLRNTGKIDIFRGDSHSKQAEEFLGDRKFDVIFIDGDHSKEGIQKDTELAMRHASPGCLFIYHDHIAVREVGEFIEELPMQFTPIDYYVANDDTKKGISVFEYNPAEKGDKKPEISIIIPTYLHLYDCLIPCIESIKKYTNFEDVEVVVVANGCQDDTRAYLEAQGCVKKIVWIKEACGFSRAINAGIRASRGKFLVLLNNDTEVTGEDWLGILLAPFSDPKVGITGPYKDVRFFWEDHRLIFREDYLVFFCAAIRREVIDRCGMLDEGFGQGYEEDIDLCIRAKEEGYRLVQVPEDINYRELNYTKEYLEVHPNENQHSFPLLHKDRATFRELPDKGSQSSKLLEKHNNRPKVSIVIPTYNHPEYLKSCIESIHEYTDMSKIEVIIVANGCKQDIRSYVNSLEEPFRLFWSDEPLGFIKAINQGVKCARGEYILLLNDDTALLPQEKDLWLNMLLAPFNNPKVGITGPVKAWRDDLKREYILFWCAIIRKDVFKSIGLLDEGFGDGYNEDVDFCLRAQDVGWEIEEVPDNINYSESFKGDPGRAKRFPIHHVGGGTFEPIYGNDNTRLTKGLDLLYSRHRKSKVYDCVMFFNELDVLEIRLNELNDVVDQFVICEARVTHNGKPKPLYFEENKQKFKQFLHKITYLVIDKFPDDFSAWDREHYQRNYLINGLRDCRDNDIILLSDVDEIISADTVRNYKADKGIAAVEMPLFYFKLDWKLEEKWYKPRIFPYSAMKGKNLQDFRGGNDYDYQYIIPNGGWHFSFLGDKESVKQKIQSYAHEEFNNDTFTSDQNIEDAINNGRDVFKRDLHFHKVVDMSIYPKYVQDRIPEYVQKELISHTLSKEWIDHCIDKAWRMESGIDKESFSAMSMLNERTRHLFNNIGSFGGLTYLEVGFWHGGSLCSILSNNQLNRACAIDNFREFTPSEDQPWLGTVHPRDKVVENLGKYSSGNLVKIIESDFFKVDLSELPLTDVYFYDGFHDFDSTYKALGYALPILNDTFLYIVDDYQWPEVNAGTKKSISELIRNGEIELIYERELLSFTPPVEAWPKGWQQAQTNLVGEWRNGVYIGLFKKVRKDKPKVYDCFSFFNELDLLEIRLAELDKHVDFFVLSEMRQTHSGQPKPLYFEENRERFSKYLHKIIHVVPPDIDTPDPWVREHYQRDYMSSFVLQKDDTIVIVSDLDEIPKGERIKEFKGNVSFFWQNQYSYYLNYNVGVSPLSPGTFSRIATWKYLMDNSLTFTGLRYKKLEENKGIKDGGWHFSWMGGGKKIVEKLQAWAHQEFNKPELLREQWIMNYIDNGKEHFGRPGVGETTQVEIDSSFPQYIQDHQEELTQKGLIKPSISGKVAIIMPYYNDAANITKSVGAILGQTYKNWTLYIIDDGSDNNKRADKILASHPKICISIKTNGGPSSARNFLLQSIDKNFDYIAFCDSDDIWPSNYLSSQLKSISDADLVYCSANHIFANGEKAIPYGIPDPEEFPGIEAMLKTPFIFISGVVMRRKCISVGDFDSRLDSIEDADYWARIAEAGYKLKKNNDVKITYMVRGGMAGKRTEEKSKLFDEKHKLTTYV